MRRCPVHDEVYEEGESCPRLGKGEHDCDKHNKPKEHEKKRVLADGGKWNQKQQRQVATDNKEDVVTA